MKKYRYTLLLLMSVTALAAGCGKEKAGAEKTEPETEAGAEMEPEQESEQEELFIPAEEAEKVPTVVTEYAAEEEYPELAQFLADYYEIPEEYQYETRYYYNFVDLNEDGKDEIFAVVIGEYTKGENGDPALLLAQGDDASFTVLDVFAEIRTPVTISENRTNGWHDIILDVYGKGVEDGYLICHYNTESGYQTEMNEFVKELEPMSGTQILSNNLIDDMDQGRYFTLKSK